MKFLTLEQVILIHDDVILPEEIQGLSADKSLEACLLRVDNRLHYGMIEDAFEVAALFAVAIVHGQCFNDANKRTAANVLDVCLVINGIELDFDPTEFGNKIIDIARRKVDEKELAKWLRQIALNI
jgi:death on curing protein